LASILWQTLRADVFRYRGKFDRHALIAAYLHDPGFRFTYHLRKLAFYRHRRKSLGIFGYVYNRLLVHHYRLKYGFDISPMTTIGPGLYIGHFGGVVISPFATLGSNVNIAQGVTIGSTSAGPRLGAPTLGDRVWVGTNAVIVGKVTIGNDALIGPGAYVYFDVPDKAVVLGNPGIVVANSGSTGYINRTIDSSAAQPPSNAIAGE
jgi:serine O-acetyltransferase